jgi:hypothetical protein
VLVREPTSRALLDLVFMIAPHITARSPVPRSEIAVLISRLQSACASGGFFHCLCDRTHLLFLANARFMVEAS